MIWFTVVNNVVRTRLLIGQGHYRTVGLNCESNLIVLDLASSRWVYSNYFGPKIFGTVIEPKKRLARWLFKMVSFICTIFRSCMIQIGFTISPFSSQHILDATSRYEFPIAWLNRRHGWNGLKMNLIIYGLFLLSFKWKEIFKLISFCFKLGRLDFFILDSVS